MSQQYRFGPGATRDWLDPGRRIYRLFLLAILFGILGMKGYLWTAFIFALLMYLFDALVVPALSVESFEISDRAEAPDAEEIPDAAPTPRRRRRRWQWNPDDPS
jgi:hypothetical protein